MSSAPADPRLAAVHPKPGAAALLESLLGRSTEQGSTAAAGPPAAEAWLPGSPRGGGPRALAASAEQHQPEHHLAPPTVEAELGTALHPDRTEALGHPRVDCWELPHAHAHRLPHLGPAGPAAPSKPPTDAPPADAA
ncbi:hypothetical protein ABPG75_009750 [Micractinium tetrahymenae]